MASRSGFEPGPLVPGNAAYKLNRCEAVIIYDCYAKPYSLPVLVNDKDPKIWSPAKLKLLAAEVLRRQTFVEDFAEAGGLKTFGPGGRFNGAIVRVVAEQPFFGFLARVTAWLKSNPRPKYPPLPEVPRRGHEWSVAELVRSHRYYVTSPEHSGPGNPAGNDSDSSVDISPVKKNSH